MRSALVALAPLAALAAPRAASAQGDAPSGTPVAARQILSLQPLQGVAGVLAMEYERAVASAVTLGAGVTYTNADILGFDELDARYASAEAKVRYYPAERALHGFDVGITAGVVHASARDETDLLGGGDRVSANGVKVGVEIDYTWRLGRTDRLALILGLGGKRIFYTSNGDRFAPIPKPMRKRSRFPRSQL
jgi:hypothetical protein